MLKYLNKNKEPIHKILNILKRPRRTFILKHDMPDSQIKLYRRFPGKLIRRLPTAEKYILPVRERIISKKMKRE